MAFDLWFTYHLPCYVCRMKLIYSVWGQLQQGEGIFQKPKYWNVFIVFKNDLLPQWRSMQGQESFEFHFHSVVTVVTLSCSRSRICVGFQNFFFISVGQLGYTSSSEADDIICMFAACISVDLLKWNASHGWISLVFFYEIVSLALD